MKSLFLFLLLANLVLFYAQTHWLDDSPVEVTLELQSLPPGVQRLVLLSEQIPAANEAPQGEELTPLKALSPRAGSETETGPADTDNTPAMDQGALKMLDAIVETPPSEAESMPPVCFTLGPFTETTAADKATSAIEALGIGVQRRAALEKTLQGYWVYLSPFKDYATATAMLKKLQAAGFKDLYIMRKGPQQNAVSLGLFREKTAAVRREKQVRAKGFKPVVSEQFREKTRQWLAFAIPGDEAVTAVSVAGVAGQYGGTRLEQKVCE